MEWMLGMVAVLALGIVLAVWVDARHAAQQEPLFRLVPARVLVEHRRRHTLR
jgi:hypothetical protein